MNIWRQFRISPWMPLDGFIHHDWAKKIIPVEIRNWICDRFDKSVMGEDGDWKDLEYWEEME